MALPQQLKAARMDDTTQGAQIDNFIGALEAALCDIFGFTIDVDVTESPFSLNNSGQITKDLVKQRAAGPVGWRLRDTTSGKEVRIVVNGTNLDVDENTGGVDSENTPSWTNRLRMAIATGALTGASATSARMGLCPQGDGDSNHFLDGTLNWSTPSAATIPSVRVRHSTNQSLASGSVVTLSFDTEDFDTDTMHSTVTNNSRITATTAGKYYVTGEVQISSNSSGARQVRLLQNGATVIGIASVPPVNGNITTIQCHAVVNLSVGDYVQLQVLQTSGSTLNAIAAASHSPSLSAYKIG